jgi:hypothetical protein
MARKPKKALKPTKYCAGTVKDRVTKKFRQCRRGVAQNEIFCSDHGKPLTSTSNPHIATEHTPPASPLHTLPAMSLYALPATSLASANTSLRKIDTSHDSTPHKANLKSTLDGNLPARREAFCANLEELTLIKMDCGKKIDSLFGEMEGAADMWGNLEEMKQSLLNSEAWKNWLEEMHGSYKPNQPLQSQANFYKILMEAQLILSKDTTAKPWCFRDILREKINFKAPHDGQEKLRALKPDIVVVSPEYLAPSLPVCGQFHCVMEHKRGERALYDDMAIQDSLIRSLQTFNDNFFRQCLYSVFVAGTKLRLFQLHRGGIVYFAKDVDIQDHPDIFLKFVAWLSFASLKQLGYGKRLDSINGWRVWCEWDHPSRRPNAEVLDSRGTTVWNVQELEPEPTELNESFARLDLNDKTPRILKMQWAYETRKTTEAHFLRKISDIPGVPKLFAEYTGASTKDFSSPDLEIERIPLKAAHTHPIYPSSSTYEPSGSGSNSISDRVTVQTSISKQLRTFPSTDDSLSRQQRWILISYCGASIDDTSDQIIPGKPFTTVDRIRALRSVIRTIYNLFCKRRIIHRDLSATNIRIAPPPASDSKHPIGSKDLADNEQPAGNLIDFDMASYWDAKSTGSKARTGTPIYMAVQILVSKTPPACHLPWYDIESVFWVLLIGEAARAGKDVFEYPAGASLKTLGDSKHTLLVTEWLGLTQENYMQGPVGKLLCRMRGFLFNYYWESAREQDSHIALDVTYEAKRFKTQGWKNLKQLGDNIANALKEGVKRIDTWFEECINELRAE